MTQAIIMQATGGPEVLEMKEVELQPPGEGEVRLKHEAIGLNFIDVYHRTGLYPLPELPWTPGMEGAGIVEAVGEGVSEFSVGDRVAYAGIPPGAYALERNIPAHRLVRLPDDIEMQAAAAMMLQGMTVRYLLKGCYVVRAGDTILVHAAAGGVGLMACQWAQAMGATVIGTVGSEDKARLAAAHGCDHPILYRSENFVERVRDITAGDGVHAVYDSIGQTTFMHSLDCLRPMGTMVSFGQSSGPIAPFDISILAAKGSLFLTRPSLMAYTAKREDLLAHAADLFDVVSRKAVTVKVNQTYALADVQQAHRDLEARRTTGSTVLLP
jgi:NADPH2:quinone reductase